MTSTDGSFKNRMTIEQLAEQLKALRGVVTGLANAGKGFIDHVWFNFFERLMVETGEIGAAEMMTVA